MAIAYSGSASYLNSYRANSVQGLSQGQLVLRTYDLALVALNAQDNGHASRVLCALIDSLDFEQGEVAVGLFRLYRYCLEQVKEGEFDIPSRIIRDLRDTWAEALGRSTRIGG